MELQKIKWTDFDCFAAGIAFKNTLGGTGKHTFVFRNNIKFGYSFFVQAVRTVMSITIGISAGPVIPFKRSFKCFQILSLFFLPFFGFAGIASGNPTEANTYSKSITEGKTNYHSNDKNITGDNSLRDVDGEVNHISVTIPGWFIALIMGIPLGFIIGLLWGFYKRYKSERE